MNFKSNTSRLVALAAVAAIGLATSNANAAKVLPKPPADTTKAGKSCTVTSGSHAGYKGTYSVVNMDDGPSLWCGDTECTGGTACKDGTSKATSVGTRALPVFRSGSFAFTR